MKFTLTTCLALIISASVSAQIFVEKAPDFPFRGVRNGAFDFGDIDGDGDQDVLITGLYRYNITSNLYINVDNSYYILAENIPFPPLRYSSVKFADLDNDGDQDLILMGRTSSESLVSLLYQNDGAGEFTLVSEHPIEAVSEANIIISDVDNNSYLDIIVQKGDGGLEKEIRLYLNEGGINNLQLAPNTPFGAIRLGSMALSDIDGDNDPDILITGMDSEAEPTVNLYLNDGTGQFTLDPNTPFQALTQGSIDFADVDGDNDQDVLVSGFLGSLLGSSTLMYLNDGEGQFSLAPNAAFIGTIWVNAQFADLDNDGDQDILVAGTSPSTRVYLNNGSGEFSLLEHEDIESVGFVSFDLEDVDGDQDLDVLLIGFNERFGPIAHLYKNNGSARFSLVEHGFINAAVGGQRSIAVADIDNDSDQDILMTGREGMSGYNSNLYINDGYANFTPLNNTPFKGVGSSNAAFADIDNDNDQDIIIMGEGIVAGFPSESQPIKATYIYFNNGDNTFTAHDNTPFRFLGFGEIAVADVDGDQDLDLILSGSDNEQNRITSLFLNDGLGEFQEVLPSPFDQVQATLLSFHDFDGDNDMDVLISGGGNSTLYINDGFGNFSSESDGLFPNVINSIQYGDVDLDGDLDLLILNASNGFGNGLTQIYRNNGNLNYDLILNTPFLNISTGSAAFSDIDVDGDLDVLVSGQNNFQDGRTELYENDGTGNYSIISDTPFDSLRWTAVLFEDFNGDNTPDVVITGYDNNYPAQISATLYINQSTVSTDQEADEFALELSLFPNPTAGMINLSDTEAKSVSVFSSDGRLLIQEEEPGETLDISQYPAGLYLVRLENQHGEFHFGRVVKE